MKKNSTHQEKSPQNNTFSVLDIAGISLSSLLFTLVWVGVFSVFLPERSEMLLSDGLRQLATKNTEAASSENVTEVYKRIHSSAHKVTDVSLKAALSLVQTGGSVTEMVVLSHNTVNHMLCTFSSCDRSGHSLIIVSGIMGAIPSKERVVTSAYEYFNTITFGLMAFVDEKFSPERPPVVVYASQRDV